MISFKQTVRINAVAIALALFNLHAQAAEPTPANIRMDFIIGGKHAPWFVALEKGFYAKRGLAATIQTSTGSADTLRTIGSGGADFGFADMATMIVAKSRGTPVQAAAQFGYVGATILWRDEGVIKGIKDLEGKSLAISPGQAQWFLMPAYCRINKIDFKAIKIQETAAPIQPAALTTLQLKNALTEVFLPFESAQVGLGYMKPEIIDKTVKVTNEYFDVGRKVAVKEVYTNQFIKR